MAHAWVFFPTLRDMVRDFDHTLRNPGCTKLWYQESILDPWYEHDKKKDKDDDNGNEEKEEDSVYMMLDASTVKQHKSQQSINRKALQEAAREYYQKNKVEIEDYPWDAGCSPTVSGSHFRAMLPSRALGVASVPRLDKGFSDIEFQKDKQAREALLRRKTVLSSKQKNKQPMSPPFLSKKKSSESCLNLFENVDDEDDKEYVAIGGRGLVETKQRQSKPHVYQESIVNPPKRTTTNKEHEQGEEDSESIYKVDCHWAICVREIERERESR
mmetsp:Transcript_42960/g.69835  ORF Transcript_42960/g.69835 Transcript_42960/m.69835 type:complete len:271 (+) Transcript_42960:681-1493(+)